MPKLSGELKEFEQPNGKTIKLKVFGDEFYARYETEEGYTVIRDAEGWFCYAELQKSALVPSKYDPHVKHIGQHISEDVETIKKKVIREQISRGYFLPPTVPPSKPIIPFIGAQAGVLDEAEAKRISSNVGLLSGRNVGIYNGTRRRIIGLTILVEFKDETTSITTQDVSNFLNADQYTANGNICSVKKYFSVMSGGKLIYSNYVFGPIKLSQKKDYYKQNLFIREALEGTLKHIHSLWFKAFDSENEHIIDAINFMYAGQTVYEGKLWPHNSTINFPTSVLFSAYKSVQEYKIEYKTHFYMLTGLGENVSQLKIGTFCHESGHLLCRFPDLYDYGNGHGGGRDGDDIASAGAGNFCLMSSGNHLGNDGSPAPISGYLRCLANWCDDVQDLSLPGSYTLTLSPSVIGIYRVSKFEFFILENYMRYKFTASLPDNGLAIWHCDTQGSNELQMGTKDKHYQCALVQADGKEDLEHDRNGGDQGDLYHPQRQGIFLSFKTTPSSKRWDGSDSGLIIRDLQSGTGDSLTFRVGGLKPIKQDADDRRYPSTVVVSSATLHHVQEVEPDVVVQSTRGPLLFNARQHRGSRQPITSVTLGVSQVRQQKEVHVDRGCGCPIC